MNDTNLPKKGSVISLLDPDGLGRTKAKVMNVDLETGEITVKYLDCVWDLKNNLMVARKGSTRRISWVQL